MATSSNLAEPKILGFQKSLKFHAPSKNFIFWMKMKKTGIMITFLMFCPTVGRGRAEAGEMSWSKEANIIILVENIVLK